MELPLVVGVDGAEPSLRATEWAAAEAVRHGVPLRLVHAYHREQDESGALTYDLGWSGPTERAEHILVAAVTRARRAHPDLPVTTEALAEEDAVTALLRAGLGAFALVTGVRGHSGLTGMLLGSVSLAVAARAHCPVIVVRGDAAGLAGTHERILLGVGEDSADSGVVRFAFREAEARGCTLLAVRAWHRPVHRTPGHPLLAGDPAHGHEDRAVELLDEALREAEREHPKVEVRRVTVEGPPRKVLVWRSAAADLLVVGARRRHGHLGAGLGRTVHAVLQHAECPVAVIPH